MKCWLCEGEVKKAHSRYLQCCHCLHMSLVNPKQTHIINDPLEIKKFRSPYKKDLAQIKIATHFFKKNPLCRRVLDIGCGPGRFIYFMQKKGFEVSGLETTASCISFARNELQLNVSSSIKKLNKPRHHWDLVTSWHSLEHIPTQKLIKLFGEELPLCVHDGTIAIVCVPNADSLQWRLFGENWVYYDDPNHLHQFSHESLLVFMKKYGWHFFQEHWSFIYSFWGYFLSFGNIFCREHNFLYFSLKRKSRNHLGMLQKKKELATSLLGLLVGLIPTLILTIYEFLKPNKAGVITLCFRIEKKSNL